jgi:hypothetical protein
MNPRHSILAVLALISLAHSALAQNNHGPTYATPDEAAADPDFAIQGEYLRYGGGEGLQVIALGKGQFRTVKFGGGLPGYYWDGQTKSESEADTAGTQELLRCYTKVCRRSCTLGACPPCGAVVLFDGTQQSLDAHWKEGAKMTEGGLLMQGVTSTDEFQDFYIHLEFRLPYMPEARGQARGNSGYYLQGRYEIQMLDSFGLEGLDNECGGIYSVSKPDVNMCLPPLTWQTYDVEFTAARFDADGNRTQPAHAKVWHNGVLIHDRDLAKGTPGGPAGGEEGAAAGPVYLQDHGNPVRYRNIWVLRR